jgi:hypothetical protein
MGVSVFTRAALVHFASLGYFRSVVRAESRTAYSALPADSPSRLITGTTSW